MAGAAVVVGDLITVATLLIDTQAVAILIAEVRRQDLIIGAEQNDRLRDHIKQRSDLSEALSVESSF
jgi:hypothetical protein